MSVKKMLLAACLVSAGYGMNVDCNRVGNMREQDRSYNYLDDCKEYCKIYLKENTGRMTQQNMLYTWQTECLYWSLIIGMREGVPPSECDNLFCSNENGYAVLINAGCIDKVYCINICLHKCAE